MKKDYSKLGGWLIFFIVSCVFTIFMAIKSYSENADALAVYATMGDEFSVISLLTKIGLFAVMIASIVGIVAVIIRKKKLLNVYFILVAVSVVVSFIAIFMYPSYLDSVISSFKSKAIIIGIRDIAVIGIWFRYFIVSSRAKVYFGEVEQLEISEASDTTTTEVE